MPKVTKGSCGVQSGFTLIELSIVLVIIGLIVGGVLVGQDLIRSAEVRATISQIEKYNTAVNTFRGKYNAFPGDLNASTATQFGFYTRGTNAGEGDGNGVIEGISSDAANKNDGFLQGGETTMFWVDLSTGNGNNVNLVDGSFSAATPTTAITASGITTPTLSGYFPPAKLGRGNVIYVYSTNGTNYFGVSNVTAVAAGVVSSNASMTVQQAYQIDKKVDDGFPATGSVTANYDNTDSGENGAAYYSNATWTASGTIAAQTPGGPLTCYDNSNTANAQATYSLSQSNGAGANCGLSFRFE